VALGGGHGLSASLSALKLVSDDITAVVTVADNGGSSGRLRDEFDVLPPGDLRMALSALCEESEWGHIWRDVLQHRFPGTGEVGGHALGNLLIVALWDLHPDPVAGLDLVARLLNAQGRVLPMAAVPLEIEADVVGLDPTDPEALTTVRGQVAVATAHGRVRSITLDPADPPAPAATVGAVERADWVVLGPGSWFTSVMPHLMVPDLRAALHHTPARRLLTLNVVAAGETAGFSAAEQIETMADHAPRLRLDVVLADPGAVDDEGALRSAAARLGAEVVVAPLPNRDRPDQHDSLRLAAAYRDILT
jgi:uncharacterized cofD-like protein